MSNGFPECKTYQFRGYAKNTVYDVNTLLKRCLFKKTPGKASGVFN